MSFDHFKKQNIIERWSKRNRDIDKWSLTLEGTSTTHHSKLLFNEDNNDVDED